MVESALKGYACGLPEVRMGSQMEIPECPSIGRLRRGYQVVQSGYSAILGCLIRWGERRCMEGGSFGSQHIRG